MHRPPKLPAAAAAGLALFLAACAGETPTSPRPTGTPASGPCTSAIALPAGPITTFAGTAISLRAQVTNGGVAAADNSSVTFTTDLGFFNENGLPTISKSTRDGIADVSPGSLVSGTATVRAAYNCASASVQIVFQAPPDSGPYISLVQPDSGSSAGGDVVVISGGRFGTNAAAISSVTFGGTPTAPLKVSDSSIQVQTPSRTLANALVPETVDVCVRYFSGVASVCKTKAFTYFAINPSEKMAVSSLSPTSGAPAGGDAVSIFGTNFGSSIATTRVTFCGLSASILQLASNLIQVTTPRKVLANPAVSETCDVVVTIDLGKVSTQSAVLVQSFTYRGSGGNTTCGADPSLFVSSLSPNTGPPDGGTTVNLVGGGFPSTPAAVRVEFGGAAAQVLSAGANAISVVSPRHALADPLIPEAVDVVVTDLGSATGRCARFVSGFTYTQQALTPTIYNVSPSGGPNDASIPVTISGDGFQSPEKVYLTGGNCASQLVEAAVSSVSRTQIVFQSPLASGSGSTPCLAGSQMDVRVSNPTTGKSATCPQCFRYGCPTVSGAAPSVLPGGTQTAVTISGANFQSPLQATFQAPGVTDYPLTVSSVSSSAVVVQMPPLSTIAPNQAACTPLTGNVVIKATGLNCSSVQASVTYRPDTPVLTSVAPATLNQDGSAVGAPGVSAVVTASGSGFAAADSYTVELTKDGALVPNTTVAATVSGSGTLTFTAPPVPDASLNSGQCSTTGGAVDGTQAVPTRFGIRVKNQKSGCTSDFAGALLYNPKISLAVCTGNLTPVINSISPTTGPNDAPTRVSIFGTGFQFPEQVFLTGGACGSQKIEVPLVAPVTLNQLVFQTPVAAGAYACLAGAQVSVQVLNPTTGKTALCQDCFKFYSCPTATAADKPVLGSSGGTVIVSGNNFQQPVTATFTASGAPPVSLVVTSVSSTSVVLQMPPYSQLGSSGSASCTPISGSINISSTGVSCPPATVPLTYRPDVPKPASAFPSSLPQDGGGTPVTVFGQDFVVGAPMTVTLVKDNSPLSGTTVPATVTAGGTLTFVAPGIPDAVLNRVNCATIPGGPVNGSQAVPTLVGIRVTDLASGCSSDLPGALTYNPRALLAVCSAALQITTASLPGATLCSLYNSPIVVSGGSTPYVYTLSGGPPWLSIGPASGILTGTPNVLSPANTGGAYSVSFTVGVSDSGSPAGSSSRSYALIVTDPDGPFSVSGPSISNIPVGGGAIAVSAAPASGFAPYNWSFVVAPPAGITFSSPTGASTNVNVAGSVPAGSYSIQVQATDSPSCAGATHSATHTITVNKS